MSSHLRNHPINPLNIREFSRKELIDILDFCPGIGKALVIDKSLSGPLSLVAEYSLLKEHGVDKIYHLDSEALETECGTVIYLTRPKLGHMGLIADQVKRVRAVGQRPVFFLYFTPCRQTICERILEDEGVLGDITIGEYHLDMFPLESDVISMEYSNSFRELFYDGDYTTINWMAKAVMKLQLTSGIIPRVIGKGYFAKVFADILLRLRADFPPEKIPTKSEIDFVIILDRNVDMITPMLTQLTYEGILDEYFGINHGIISLNHEISGVKDKKKFALNSSDRLFNEIRDSNISVVGKVLNKNAKIIKQTDEARHQAKSVTELKDFVSKLGGMLQDKQSLQLHTNITEFLNKNVIGSELLRDWDAQQTILDGVDLTDVLKQIEEAIYARQSITRVLRLLCLLFLTGYVFKPKVLEQLKQDIIHAYGFEYLQHLDALAHVGLLRNILSKQNASIVKNNLKLVVDEVDEQNPQDISYVYSGYAPLSVRIIEALTRNLLKAEGNNAWKSLEEYCNFLPGPSFDLRQDVFGTKKQGKKNGLVVFIGGCTLAEISALRFLASNRPQTEACDYFVFTSDLTNGDKLMGSLMELSSDNNE